MRNKSLVIIVSIVVVLVGAFAVTKMFSSYKTNKDKQNSMSAMQQSNANQPSNATSPAQATNAVAIENFSFSPANITVKAGTTVTWTNKDNVNHTVTADDPSADAPASQDIAKGQTYSFTFKTVGTYKYHCQLHPSMTGTVKVTE